MVNKSSEVTSLSFLSVIAQFLLIVLLGAWSSAVAQKTQRADGRAKIELAQPLTLRWRYDSSLTLNLTPASDDHSIYVPLAGGTIVSLKASDGQLNWRSEIGGELSASPVADRDRIYVAAAIGGETGSGPRNVNGTLRSIGREGGVTQWVRTLAQPLRGALTVKDGKLFAGGGDGKFYAFDCQTGEARWAFTHSAAFNAQPVVFDSRVYIGGEDGAVLALDQNSGKLLWRYRSKGPVRGPAAIADNTVYFGSGDGHVYALNATSGKLRWKKRTGAGVQAVARVDEALLVASLDNFVYRYSLHGRRLWKRQLPGRIASQPFTTSDGALFTPLSSSAAVVLGLSDGRPVNSLPTEEELTTSAAPIGVGDAVFVTTQHGLLAFAQPREHTTKSR
jgi:eukaryotic-like serine/threonine-protein kinase